MTDTHSFNSEQGALTIFYDQINKDAEEPSSIGMFMEKVFPPQQFIYEQRDKLPDCNTMVKDIMERRDRMDIILPASKRMTFCYYIDLKDLTKEWIDEYYQRAEELRLKQPINNTTDQHHVVCFRTKVADLDPDTVKKQSTLLIDLATRNKEISKEVFMLRAPAMEKFDAQENGLVECLYLQSREANTMYINAMYLTTAPLRTVTYEDYYEDRMTTCNKHVEEIDKWLGTYDDPNLEKLKEAVKTTSLKSLADYHSITNGFGRMSALYPVSKDDFVPKKFLFFFTIGYTLKFNRNQHPMLKAQKEKMVADRREELIENVDVSTIMKEVVEAYHYPDLKLLSEENPQFTKAVANEILVNLNQDQGSGEGKEFINGIIESIMKKIRETDLLKTFDDPEKGLHGIKEREKRRYQKEMLSAGAYDSLDECFTSIDEKTGPVGIKGVFGQLSYKIALVNDRCNEELKRNQRGIIGFSDAYNYDGIEPCEIVVTKIYSMLDMENADAENMLIEMLG